jgi:hypothetical protein
MKATVKILMTVGLVSTMLSCKTSFNASKTMQVEENRQAIYQEIISNPVQLTNFLSAAQKNEEAKKILMKTQMEQMESGNMQMMMDKNPEMKEKMQSHMQIMMDKNPEMMQMMHSKMLDKMMGSEMGRKMIMGKMQTNNDMKKEMKENMMQMMHDNPDMMGEMMQKMMEQNPEMMQKLMEQNPEMIRKMMDKNPEMMKKMKGKMKNEK